MSEQTIILPPQPSGNGHDANYRVTVYAPKRRFLSYLLDRWWVVLLCVLLAVAAAVTWDTLQPETYTSYAQLYLRGNVQFNLAGQVTEESRNYFGTQIELLKSAMLQQAAYKGAGTPPAGMTPIKLEVIQPLDASILRLRATGADPRYTQAFLQTLIDEYLLFKRDTRLSNSLDAVESLNLQLSKEKEQLEVEQDRLTEFVRSNNVAELDERVHSKGLYLLDLQNQLNRHGLERELLQNAITSAGSPEPVSNETLAAPPAANATAAVTTPATAAGTDTNQFSAMGAVTNAAPARADAQLKDARLQLAKLRLEREGKAEHGASAMRPYDDEIKKLEGVVRLLENQNLADKKSDLLDLEKRIAATQARVPPLEADLRDLNDRIGQAQRLRNNVQREQAYLDDLRAMLKRMDLGRNLEQEKLAVLEPASAALLTRHLLVLWVVLAVGAGVAVGAGIVFVWHLFDDRFASLRDIKDQFGEILVGLIPRIKARRSRPREALLREGDTRHAYVESFRHLRSALLLSSSRPQSKTLLITSAGPGEGKTTIAANLAGTLARSGLRVALVDADPHGGELHHLFELPDGPGVFDFLRGETPVEAIIHSTPVPGLVVVPHGATPHEMDGLFLRPKFEQLMNTLRQEHDFVILDGAPLLAADDAALLAPHADSVIVVVSPLYTRARLLRQALDMLYHRRAKQVAMVFNRARADDVAGKYAMYGRASSKKKNGASRGDARKLNGSGNHTPRIPTVK